MKSLILCISARNQDVWNAYSEQPYTETCANLNWLHKILIINYKLLGKFKFFNLIVEINRWNKTHYALIIAFVSCVCGIIIEKCVDRQGFNYNLTIYIGSLFPPISSLCLVFWCVFLFFSFEWSIKKTSRSFAHFPTLLLWFLLVKTTIVVQ